MRLFTIVTIAFVMCLGASVMAAPVQYAENFDADPGWVGLNNTADGNNFGYQADTNLATTDTITTKKGEIGGIVARTEGYYAKNIGILDPSNTVLTATGKFYSPDYAGGNCYIGWFNSSTFSGSIFAGFPKNIVGFYTEGFGGVGANAVLNPVVNGSDGAGFSHDSGADRPLYGVVHDNYQWGFEMVFDPNGGTEGYGTLTLTVLRDGEQNGTPGVVNLLAGEKENILNLDHFGIWCRNYGQSTTTQEIYFDDLAFTADGTFVPVELSGFMVE